jgi:type IX secretion system substrate protein
MMAYYENGFHYIVNKINLTNSSISSTVLPGYSQSLAHYLQTRNITAFRGLGYKLIYGQSLMTKDTIQVFKQDGSYGIIVPYNISSKKGALFIKQYDKLGYICPDFNEPVIDTSSSPTQITFGVAEPEKKGSGIMTALPDTVTVLSNDLNLYVLCQGEKQPAASAINNAAGNNLSVHKNSVYPNPVKDILHVYTEATTIISVNNQSGKTMFTKQVNGKTDINVSNLEAGMYFLKFYDTGKVEKVVVIK